MPQAAKVLIDGPSELIFDYAIPDDVQALVVPAFRHRIVLGPTAEIDGRTPDDVLNTLINRIDAPR